MKLCRYSYTHGMGTVGKQSNWDAVAPPDDAMEISRSYRVVKLKIPELWKTCPPFSTSIPRHDWMGGRIYAINKHTEGWKTLMEYQTSEADILPDGMRIYQSPREVLSLKDIAFSEVRRLFTSERHYIGKYPADLTGNHARSRKTILLYLPFGTDDEKAAFQIRRGLQILEKRGCHTLKQVCEIYYHTFCQLMKIDPREAECYMNIVRYAPREGFRVHVDGINTIGIHGKDNLPGPIFNIAMGESEACTGHDGNVLYTDRGEKPLDIIPTLAEDSTLDPVRVIVKQWRDVVVLDGFSRLAVQHAIPFDNKNEMFTLAFKYAGVHRRLKENRDILTTNGEDIKFNRYLNTEIVPMIVDN